MNKRRSILRHHELEVKDSIWNPFDSLTDHKEYIQISASTPLSATYEYGKFGHSHEFEIDKVMKLEKRIRYNFWMALADVGGFHDGLFLLLSFLMSPFAATLFKNDLMRGKLFNWSLNLRQKGAQNRLV